MTTKSAGTTTTEAITTKTTNWLNWGGGAVYPLFPGAGRQISFSVLAASENLIEIIIYLLAAAVG